MHTIQNQILKKLMFAKKAKYSTLKPKEIEGNLFSYHLKNLVKEDFIELKNDYYTLTTKGKQHVDRLSTLTLSTRIQPKIVTLIVLKNKGKYLMYKRKKMPFMDYVGFPYGKIHLEERVQDSAERELLEKTGLVASLKHRGEAYITVDDDTEMISHMLCHVFTGSKYREASEDERQLNKNIEGIGECFWSTIEEIPKNKLIPGVTQIEKLLTKNKNNLFFAEYFLNVSEDTE